MPMVMLMSGAREYLEEIEAEKHHIDRLRKEIDQIRRSINLLPGVTYDGDRIQTSTTDDHVLAAVEDLIDKERRLADLIQEYHEDRLARIDLINRLANDKHRSILAARYVDGLRWWTIQKRLKISESSIFRLHREAMEELEKMM